MCRGRYRIRVSLDGERNTQTIKHMGAVDPLEAVASNSGSAMGRQSGATTTRKAKAIAEGGSLKRIPRVCLSDPLKGKHYANL